MRQAYRMTLAAWVSFVLAVPARSATGGDAVAEARAHLASHALEKAVTVLEDALAESNVADRAAIIGLLRETYRDLIAQSEAAGRARDAAGYRDNLAILDESPTDKPTPAAAPVPAPAATPAAEPRSPLPTSPPPAVARPEVRAPETRRLPRSSQAPDLEPSSEPRALPEPAPLPAPVLEGPGAPRSPHNAVAPAQTPTPARPEAARSLQSQARPRPAATPAVPVPADDDLSRADQLFTEKKYQEAGRIYALMAGQNRLPAQRRQIWAYCRWVAVVAQMNAHPQTDREWDAIEQEIRSVQRLTPGNWYGEYLQNRVNEARRGARTSSRAGKLVVRGSAPEEAAEGESSISSRKSRTALESPPAQSEARSGEQALGLPSASSPDQSGPERDSAAPRARAQLVDPSTPEAVANEPLAAAQVPAFPAPADPASPPAPPAWHVRETANFTIYHTDADLAERAGKAAEAVRAQQAKRWGSTATRSSWNPRCEIYLYPTSREFAQHTGQPESSPGFSTMGMHGARVTTRRVNLRADHPQMLEAILPHEVTHVVLADLFTQQQIPRWADEGMAVLAEPATEQQSRAADLTAPLKEGRVFKLSDLMAIDYPNAEAWSLYYAQSVSLTQFLVKLGTPEQFIAFVRGAQRTGIEASLRSVYKIEGFPDLEDRWQKFALRQAGELTASSRELSSTIEPTRRQ